MVNIGCMNEEWKVCLLLVVLWEMIVLVFDFELVVGRVSIDLIGIVL